MKIFLITMFLVLALVAGAYEPLTMEEAREYVAVSPEEAVADIIALDTIEHAVPVAMMPETQTILKNGRDLIIHYDPGYITFTVRPYLRYRLLMEDHYVKDFVPSPKVYPSVLAILGGSITAVVTEVLLVSVAPILREGISVGAGTLVGLALLFLLQ